MFHSPYGVLISFTVSLSVSLCNLQHLLLSCFYIESCVQSTEPISGQNEIHQQGSWSQSMRFSDWEGPKYEATAASLHWRSQFRLFRRLLQKSPHTLLEVYKATGKRPVWRPKTHWRLYSLAKADQPEVEGMWAVLFIYVDPDLD